MSEQLINCFCFDLDGTLCNVSHRKQWVASQPKNWDAWNAAMCNDVPNYPVLDTLYALAREFDIVLVSGRGSEYRKQTEDWLAKYDVPYSALYMRAEGDHRPDDVIKAELADEVEREYRILGVFDDRKRVVEMWRRRGIFVFDVSQGESDF